MMRPIVFFRFVYINCQLLLQMQVNKTNDMMGKVYQML